MDQNTDTKQSEPQETKSEGKKTYETPEVTDYGDLRELTRTNPFAGGADDFSLDFSAT